MSLPPTFQNTRPAQHMPFLLHVCSQLSTDRGRHFHHPGAAHMHARQHRYAISNSGVHMCKPRTTRASEFHHQRQIKVNHESIVISSIPLALASTHSHSSGSNVHMIIRANPIEIHQKSIFSLETSASLCCPSHKKRRKHKHK